MSYADDIARARKLTPPCGYVGGKRRIAPAIVELILRGCPERVVDVGCGSGAVTLELLNKGYPARCIKMVDSGPWGAFWSAASLGDLDVDLIGSMMSDVWHREPCSVADYVYDVACDGFSPEVFLLLQAASYGSTPVWHDGEAWRRGRPSANRAYKARGYWSPGPSSAETKPRGTIFKPMEIASMVRAVAEAVSNGVIVEHAPAESVLIEPGSAVYVDPPYAGASGYQHSMMYEKVVAAAQGCDVYVSESRRTKGATESFLMSSRKRASLNGASGKSGEEWVNYYAPHKGTP